jgi:hypothetical protein
MHNQLPGTPGKGALAMLGVGSCGGPGGGGGGWCWVVGWQAPKWSPTHHAPPTAWHPWPRYVGFWTRGGVQQARLGQGSVHTRVVTQCVMHQCHNAVSNASCTTNCLAPLAKVG